MTIEHSSLTGGCLCRAVRYVAKEKPITVRHCWCRDCQYWAAGSSTVNAVFPAGAVSMTGELAEYRSMADSGNQMIRKFCPSCGTPVASASEARPHLVILRVGTLDDPSAVKPVATIWRSRAPTWACVNGSIPAHDKGAPG
ncbi:MAG: GFA family protein [Micropepsaceae bacterium]